MKALKNTFFLIFFIQIVNLSAFSQTESKEASNLVLKNVKYPKTFTIKPGENIVLYLSDKSKIKGKMIYKGDSILMVDSTSIDIGAISRIKYCEGFIKQMKYYGKVWTIESAIIAVTGLAILFAAPRSPVDPNHDDFMNFTTMQLIGISGFISGFTLLEYAIPMWLFPYRSFKLNDRWVIVSDGR